MDFRCIIDTWQLQFHISWSSHVSIKFTLPRERKWILGVSLTRGNFNFTEILKNWFSLLFTGLLIFLDHGAPFTCSGLPPSGRLLWLVDISKPERRLDRRLHKHARRLLISRPIRGASHALCLLLIGRRQIEEAGGRIGQKQRTQKQEKCKN